MGAPAAIPNDACVPWEIAPDSGDGYLVVTFAGTLTPDELGAAVRATLAEMTRRGCFTLLADCTALAGGHSIVDLYYLVDVVVATGFAHKIKEAVVTSDLTDPPENVRFWETTARNRGIEVRAFTERAAAIAWLREAAT